jgi:uncharacterized protein (TIGR00661 family)
MSGQKKKFLFVVQGEGRGHMTQSIAMQSIILNAGMEVCGVLIGKSPQRKIPPFYTEKIKAPITPIESPNFVTDSKMKAIRMFPSVVKNIRNFSTFRNSLKIIDEKIKEYKPDVIINFYDPLIGLYYLFNKPKIPMVCVAHQYLFNHPGFEFPKGHLMDRMSLKFYTNLTAHGATKRLALSFYPFENSERKKVFVVPPLLRDEVFSQKTNPGDYLLVYLVNSGYLEDIISWHEKNPEVEVHCFIDKKSDKEVEQFHEKLFFHKINDQKFLSMMANARGLVSTAGFESVCEAMFLGKPVFMVPVEGHFEQYCNSRDAYKAGAGIYDSGFKITRFLNYLAGYRNGSDTFRNWVNQSPNKTIEQLKSVL